MHTLVLGGGIIGLCTAHELAQAGHEVTVVDRDPQLRDSCSGKNAGMVVPSHFIPLAAPGVIGQGLRWMLDPASPFFLRPRLDPDLWRWCWQFFRHSNARHVAASMPLLRDLGLESRRLIVELMEELGLPIEERGLLLLCRTEEGLEEEAEVVEKAHEIGIEAELCDAARVRELDPDATMDVAGGVWFAQDCHLDPGALLRALRTRITELGGRFVDAEVAGFEREGDRITAARTTAGETLKADSFVLAAGSWTPGMARQLGLRLPMQAGKGYSLTLENPREMPRLCSLLKEGRVAVTPIGDDRLRVAGTMEICGNDLSINPVRLRGIVDAFCQFFPAFRPEDFADLEPWAGLRPCSPDGLPYLGRAPGLENVVLNTGHNMLGLSLGPVSGRLAAALVDPDLPAPERSIDLARMNPGRFR